MKKKNKYAVMLGSIKSKKKAAASRKNGLLGGRPVKLDKLDIHTQNVLKSLQT